MSSTPYTQSQSPANLQPLALPVVDTDLFVVQHANDSIVRSVAGSAVKTYAGGGGCDEPLISITPTFANDTFNATIDWSAGCTFLVTCDMTGQGGGGQTVKLIYQNLPPAGTVSTRNIFILLINDPDGAYIGQVTDSLGSNVGLSIYPGGGDIGGLGFVKVVQVGTSWPQPIYTNYGAWN